MEQTWNKEQRKKKKELLRQIYPNYNPKHHDYFVMLFNLEQERLALVNFHKEHGIDTLDNRAE